MANKISTGRFRLLCREVAGKVGARRDRQAPKREAVLRELLRRVESNLGRKPADLGTTTADAAGINEAFDRLVDSSGGVTWQAIVDEELLDKVLPAGRADAARSASDDAGSQGAS